MVLREPAYAAARASSAMLEGYFSQRRAASGPSAASAAPDRTAIAALIDAAFWASLQREEKAPPRISLAYLDPDRAVRPMRLAEPLPLGPRALARMAPAVERPGIHLGVWAAAGGALHVWGTTRAVPTLGFVLEVVGAGLLVVKHRVRDDSPKFQNVAVFEGEQVKVVGRGMGGTCAVPRVLESLLWHERAAAPDEKDDVLLRLAVSMRAHGKGGTLLVVPAGSSAWRASIVHPIDYAVQPSFTELAELAGAASDERAAALGRVVEAVAGLTAVDGATVISDGYEVLAFGAKIARPDGRPRVERVAVSEPIEGAAASVMTPLQLGGTRHSSAAQFAQDQPDALAMVASQDGRFTLFAWSARDAIVHAHRVEALLL